ncbi:MAG: cytochrome ubiquinol oxidase subunit I [Rhodobacteraceae bacterium]|nr:cytochrome ubiquinol oxidase subunit I [Paracoccaceae bacterium]
METTFADFMARIDFALITSLHIIYPPLTIGLSLLIFFSEWRWLRTDQEKWYRLTRFFEKLFIINFGAGVATGVTMEMAFGILFGPFSTAAGPVFGHMLGFETITAFMYEAGFVGLMIFGWHKIGRRMHLFATFNVALASFLSAFWIIAANSWMQSPAGVKMVGGQFLVSDWLQIIFNPDSMTAIPHMIVACLELSLFFVAAVSARQLLKQRNVSVFAPALRLVLPVMLIVALGQIWIGDSLGRTVAQEQPAALAAMEGHFKTDNPDGSPNTKWNVVMWPNADKSDTVWAFGIPHVLSVLEDHKWVSRVPGLDQFKPENRPPVVVPFYSFRVMVAIGFALFGVSAWGLWLMLRGRLANRKISDFENRWFLRAVLASAFLPYLAIWTGWWTREVARQPWVVYGLMTVQEGRSQLSATAEVVWFIGFAIFGFGVLFATGYFLFKVIAKGPDMETKIPRERDEHHQSLGTLPPIETAADAQ